MTKTSKNNMSTNRVPVFRLFQPTWSEPAYFVMRDVAIRMVSDRAATCINRGRAIRLTFERPENLRDESARIGPATVHAYACGSKRAIAAVEGWAPAVVVCHSGRSEESLLDT
jgi:hypothetical protein